MEVLTLYICFRDVLCLVCSGETSVLVEEDEDTSAGVVTKVELRADTGHVPHSEQEDKQEVQNHFTV